MAEKDQRILIAKKLLSKLLKIIKPEEKYEEVISKVAKDTRQEILNLFKPEKNDIYGVFGKDDYFISNLKHKEKGTRLIQRIASSICKNFSRPVITGSRLYYKKAGKVKTERTMINEIIDKAKREDDEMWRTTFSKILGFVPNLAIFLIDCDRSASSLEEASFHSIKENKGLGIILPNKKYKPCKYLKEMKVRKTIFHQCTSSDYSECTRRRSGCICIKLKINKTTAEPFISKNTHSLIVSNDLENIEKIIVAFISINKFYSN